VNDVLPTIIGILLIACAAGFALLPLARGDRAAAVTPESLSTDRSAIYRQVLELEFDYQLGKLSTEDYQQIAADLLGQAGDLMREERGGPMAELDDEIEREIAAARAAFSAARKSGRAGRSKRTVSNSAR
jgi:hypothetical protein